MNAERREYIGPVSGLYSRMTLTGRLHPLLVHFPIALILVAAVAELVALVTEFPEWRAVAAANVRAGAVCAVASAGAGWLFGLSGMVTPSPLLEWHRWLGIAGALAAVAAALATKEMDGGPGRLRLYRVALFSAAALVAAAGHFGAA